MNIAEFCSKKLHVDYKSFTRIPGGDLLVAWVKVTPKLAADWLANLNQNNRKVRQGKVQQFVMDMKAGRWHTSHQGMAFDEDGVLISGQHRLEAVVAANTTIPLLVFINCPVHERSVVDQGSARSARDVASLAHGDDVDALSIAVCRTMKYGPSARGQVQMTPQETYEFYRKHAAAIKTVLGAVYEHRKVKGVTTAAVLAPVCRAYYQMTRAACVDFVTVLATGMGQECDKPIITLRNWLLENQGSTRDSKGRSRSYLRTETVLDAWINDRDMPRLSDAQEELFALPGEKVAV